MLKKVLPAFVLCLVCALSAMGGDTPNPGFEPTPTPTPDGMSSQSTELTVPEDESPLAVHVLNVLSAIASLL